MNIYITSFIALLALPCKAQTINYADKVNTMIGTASTFELSNGNTYPSTSLPFGTNSWTPQTGKNGDGWTYQYHANKIRGIKQTHQPSPWINDYGAFSILPTTGTPIFDEEKRATWFSHKAENSTPYEYSVYLADYDTRVKLSPTAHTAIVQIDYPNGRTPRLVIDGYKGGSHISINREQRTITGWVSNNHGGVPEGFKNHFIIKLNCDIDSVSLYLNNEQYTNSQSMVEGDHAGAIITFKPHNDLKVTARISSSFISEQQAWVSLQREQGQLSYDAICQKAKTQWNDMLSRVAIEGGTDAQTSTFYTALYRILLFPRAFHEITEKGDTVHYSPYNGKIEKGVLYTDNGFWDTFRAVFPFFSLVYPEISADIMRGLVNTYRESGWLPEWASPGHRDCMIGSNSASIIAEAYVKGIRGYDINTLYEALVKNSNHEGPLHSVGRRGVTYYNRLGYVPYDVGINENAGRTLEYAYDDFCLWQLTKALKRPLKEQKTFFKRAFNYKNVIDASIGFARGRNADGTFQSPFRPDKWGDAFTEGCSWHWTWCVFHDPAGLISMLGGKDKFAEKLESVFTTSPTFDYSYYGQQIHEITEMLIAGMGQYAHGNQPIQHAPYLFNWAGRPWLTQKHVRNIMDRLYTNAPDGLCGDEDNGQTSAWYVFSALGFYPVAPATGQYAIGSPLFPKAVVKVRGGKLVITAPNNSRKNIYIHSVKWNGQSTDSNYLEHNIIANGGTLQFDMSDQPNTQRGTADISAPYSLSNQSR